MNKKKLKHFLDINFPQYNNCTILEDTDEKAVAILEYGKYDKIRVTIGLDGESQILYKLLQTDFI